MRLILNNYQGCTSFKEAFHELIDGADTLSVAVSYLQVSGWELFRNYAQSLSLSKMRMVCTDQFGITQPAAVKRAIESKVQIRNFVGGVVYHPKVFLAHDRNGRPSRFFVGSANLSASAFSNSVEAGLMSDEADELTTLNKWFNDLFEHQSADFTPELLDAMEVKWRQAAAERALSRLQVRGKLVAAAGTKPVPLAPEDVDTIDDILATIRLPLGLLNMDYAGNNVRNIAKAREVMASPTEASGKQQSELKLLGFMRNGNLTPLGRAAAAATTNEAVARFWCEWLEQTPDAQLRDINERLLVAKRVFPQFWQLKKEVREYFLVNAQSPGDRRTLQTIELLCNACQIVQELSLSDIRTLSSLLQSDRVPQYIRKEITEYFANKGQRGWDTNDRRIVPLAWRSGLAE